MTTPEADARHRTACADLWDTIAIRRLNARDRDGAHRAARAADIIGNPIVRHRHVVR